MSGQNKRMFSDICKNYDFMNHVMGLGLDIVWRGIAARESLIGKRSYAVLDIASGTGDLSIAISRACSRSGKEVAITGVDFNSDMLEIAKSKAEKLGLGIKFKVGDALALEFPNGSFDVVASAFGLRNFDSLNTFTKEARRVLKKGGRLVLLEMAEPDRGLMRSIFKLYSKIILLEGMLVNRSAYSYLVSSIKRFDKQRLLAILEKRGFAEIKLVELPSKAAFLVTARRP